MSKKFRALEAKVDSLRAAVDSLSDNYRQLRCKHLNTIYYYSIDTFCERCMDCNKILRSFKSYEEMCLAKAKDYEKRIQDIKEELGI